MDSREKPRFVNSARREMESSWMPMDAELEALVAQAPEMVEVDSRTSTPTIAPCRVELPKRFQSIRISGGKVAPLPLKRKLVPATTGMGLFKEFQSWDDPLKPLGNPHLLIMMKHLEQQLSVPIISGVMADAMAIGCRVPFRICRSSY